MNDFAKAIFAKRKEQEIMVKWKNGNMATYTKNVYLLLVADPECEYIQDCDTGVLLFVNDKLYKEVRK